MTKYEIWLDLKDLLEKSNNLLELGDWLDEHGEDVLNHLIPTTKGE